jgi:hypothetical protein
MSGYRREPSKRRLLARASDLDRTGRADRVHSPIGDAWRPAAGFRVTLRNRARSADLDGCSVAARPTCTPRHPRSWAAGRPSTGHRHKTRTGAIALRRCGCNGRAKPSRPESGVTRQHAGREPLAGGAARPCPSREARSSARAIATLPAGLEHARRAPPTRDTPWPGSDSSRRHPSRFDAHVPDGRDDGGVARPDR